MSKFTFRVEMNIGQDQRLVDADSFLDDHVNGWIIFHRSPPTGGSVEYWRVRRAHVVALETIRKS